MLILPLVVLSFFLSPLVLHLNVVLLVQVFVLHSVRSCYWNVRLLLEPIVRPWNVTLAGGLVRVSASAQILRFEQSFGRPPFPTALLDTPAKCQAEEEGDSLSPPNPQEDPPCNEHMGLDCVLKVVRDLLNQPGLAHHPLDHALLIVVHDDASALGH